MTGHSRNRLFFGQGADGSMEDACLEMRETNTRQIPSKCYTSA